MVPLSEEDTFFSLCTLVEDMMPPDYYSAEHDILGARVDQLVFASVRRLGLLRRGRALSFLWAPALPCCNIRLSASCWSWLRPTIRSR